jgi:hypothetical protein
VQKDNRLRYCICCDFHYLYNKRFKRRLPEKEYGENMIDEKRKMALEKYIAKKAAAGTFRYRHGYYPRIWNRCE